MDFKKAKIVFYDGDCGFCNRSVAFILKNDQTKSIQFASIQSDFTQKLFAERNWNTPDLSTFYFLENEQLFAKSTAAIKLSKHFSFPQSWLQGMIIVPRFIRDFVYNFIAKRRYRISNGYCYAPNKEERGRFVQ